MSIRDQEVGGTTNTILLSQQVWENPLFAALDALLQENSDASGGRDHEKDLKSITGPTKTPFLEYELVPAVVDISTSITPVPPSGTPATQLNSVSESGIPHMVDRGASRYTTHARPRCTQVYHAC